MSEAAETPVCPCDVFCHPKAPYNPAGLLSLAYRVGDFASFRHALLKPQSKEEALAAWRPGAHGDLAVQIVEWWAYLADVLTFYNERIANESYLRTALLDESVRRLIRVLGYRPRPGIGARGILAALSSSPVPFTLPKGFPAGSKPAPGKDPQVFELDADTTVAPGGAVAVTPVPGPVLSGTNTDTERSVLLKGVINTVKTGDRLLLLRDDWPDNASAYALAEVRSVQPERAPDGKKNTRVSMKLDRTLPAAAANTAPGHRLLKSTQTAHPWHDPTHKAKVFAGASVHLDSLTRSLKIGDPVLFEVSVAGLTDTLVRLTEYQEIVWYANPKAPATPEVPPDNPPNVPVPIPHALLKVAPTPSGDWNSHAGAVLLHFAWQEVGEPVAAPASSISSSGAPVKPAQPLPVKAGAPILVEDATGAGSPAAADDPSAVRLKEPPVELQAPLRALLNLLPVSRGQSVREEVLGSGDASRAGQEFVLQKKPLTYLADPGSHSGDGYSSTLRVWVDGIEWHEVTNFYGQSPEARVFVTREEEGKTHVQFRRLPSGAGNVVAGYRQGSGADVPAAGALSVILQPFPGLTALRNPVPPGGGSDPDPREKVRRYAPRSVLTFGRAISADDYEALAAQAPGVSRARSYWAWDTESQRTMVTVYVGDDDGAVNSAKSALDGAIDPNRPVSVLPATAVPLQLRVAVRRDADYPAEPLVRAVRTALLDPDSGLLGTNTVRIGGSVFESEIFAACLTVPGALAVSALEFAVQQDGTFGSLTAYRHDAGEGRFFRLDDANLEVTAHVG